MSNIALGEAKTPDNTRIYAIGDVHGYLDLLFKIHDLISDDLAQYPVKHHKIIHLGDYIDRGPNSKGCIQYLINLMASNENVSCLKGNHEEKLIRFLDDPIATAYSFLTYGGAECALSYGVQPPHQEVSDSEILAFRDTLLQSVPRSHIEFIGELLFSQTEGDYFFAHAGVRPGVSLDAQTHQDLMGIRKDFISYHGLFEKVIVHGHTPHHPIEIKQNRINADTMAYATQELTAVVLEGNQYRILAT